jgi:hypothetical protein
VLLPENLAGFLKTEAARRDFTISGLLRHYVSEAHRAAPPPEWVPPGQTIPGFSQTPEGIAQAKEHIAKLGQELQRIRHRQKIHADDATDEDRAARINFELDVVRKGIDMATRMLPRNGGQNV